MTLYDTGAQQMSTFIVRSLMHQSTLAHSLGPFESVTEPGGRFGGRVAVGACWWACGRVLVGVRPRGGTIHATTHPPARACVRRGSRGYSAVLLSLCRGPPPHMILNSSGSLFCFCRLYFAATTWCLPVSSGKVPTLPRCSFPGLNKPNVRKPVQVLYKTTLLDVF